MKHTLGTAAESVGVSKSTIYRAVKAGRLSATRNGDGEYQIDPAELHRVYEPTAARAEERVVTQDATVNGAADETALAAGLNHVQWLQSLADDQRRQLREKDEVIADQLRIMEERDDAWRRRFEMLEQKLLPAPEPIVESPRSFWRRMLG